MTTTASTPTTPTTDDAAPPADDRIEPFTVDVPEVDLDDLRTRLARTRWPDAETVDDASQGPRLAKVHALVEHWERHHDWRRCERALNAFPQLRTTIDGLGIHALHVRSPEPDALPLVLTHGWPGSVLEFLDLLGPLTDPAAHGGDPRDAFHVVVPSLPGFGFSDRPTGPGWGVERTAAAWVTLMERLGYDRWAAQGGDWGAAVTAAIAARRPAGLVGVHLNLVPFQPTPDEVAHADAAERAMLADAQHYARSLSAYSTLQATHPQSLGYALADSPVGLAGWIYSLFTDVTGTPGDPESSLSLDQMLDDITLYWLTGTAASSTRFYYESMAGGAFGPAPTSTVPTAISMFPGEQLRMSRRWAEARFADLRHFGEPAAGGHFAALEQPALMVEELRTGLRTMR